MMSGVEGPAGGRRAAGDGAVAVAGKEELDPVGAGVQECEPLAIRGPLERADTRLGWQHDLGFLAIDD